MQEFIATSSLLDARFVVKYWMTNGLYSSKVTVPLSDSFYCQELLPRSKELLPRPNLASFDSNSMVLHLLYDSPPDIWRQLSWQLAIISSQGLNMPKSLNHSSFNLGFLTTLSSFSRYFSACWYPFSKCGAQTSIYVSRWNLIKEEQTGTTAWSDHYTSSDTA